MKLTLAQIEACFALLVDMLRRRGIEELETGQRDFYWSVLSGDWLDFNKEPKVAVGSLDDDFAELRRLLSEDSWPSSVDLDRLSSVLRLLSEELDRLPPR